MDYKYSYNIYPSAKYSEFKAVCNEINMIEGIEKSKSAQDVDGSCVQMFYLQGKKILIMCDVEVDAVYINSEIELPINEYDFTKKKRELKKK